MSRPRDELTANLSDRCSRQAAEMETLRAQRDQARTWAVSLEQENAEKDERIAAVRAYCEARVTDAAYYEVILGLLDGGR